MVPGLWSTTLRNFEKGAHVENKKCLSTFFVPREVSRTMLMHNFYKAEARALQPEVVIRSFGDVGLRPFNPAKILENCKKFSPVQPGPKDVYDLSYLATAIKTCMGDELHRAGKMLQETKCVKVTNPKKALKRGCRGKKASVLRILAIAIVLLHLWQVPRRMLRSHLESAVVK